MTKKTKWAAAIIIGGIIVIWWMKNNLQSAGVINSPVANAAGTTNIFGIPQLQLQPLQQNFASTINAQPGTTAFPSELQ